MTTSTPNSSWVNFLRQYGPIPSNDNMYDETIQRIVKKKGIEPILIEAPYLAELIENFNSENPKSIILTGTAGDGKTYHSRETWYELGGTFEQWEESGNIKKISIHYGKTLYVIKDLSELAPEERDILILFAQCIKGKRADVLFLIAANDGQLLEALKQVDEDDDAKGILNIIEDMMVTDLPEHPRFDLRLYNLSRISAAWALPRVIEAVTAHDGWRECDHCVFRDHHDVELRCPIWENKKRLEGEQANSVLRTRLIDLLELCEINGVHLPIRQLLLLVSNMILGHPEARDRLLRCQEIPNIIEKRTTAKASIYRNIFGENLPERRRESTAVFETLGRFGIGNETSNKIDNILIFGEDDPELKNNYQELMLSDTYYGADYTYKIHQKEYLEGISEDEGANFLQLVRSQRQRLFFSIPEGRVDEFKLWELTTFHYAGEFLTKVYRTIQQGGRASSQVISRLVKGLNRISTGLLTKTLDKLILATSGSHSQARLSKIFESSISVMRDRGESVQIKADSNGKINIEVSLSSSPSIPAVKLYLHLIRYEFLSRVAEGALPGSFSRECYEDILAFKSRLLKQLERRKVEDGENEYFDDSMSLHILKLNAEGNIDKKTVEVLY
ncbi:hypothetical protein M0651_07505 [Paenibacillus sp. MBLB2552]|uniref:Uncharacterized protein n=1 Tax=Paenibacillus mellifer TaxID=2937794 RepID=A0A9X2BSP9_9BACL|nr:hypothetical protein [Paenibacillus mellifer]MCK8487011.1 hypothetical protein [Paenibacillus mellifer]